MKHVYREDRGTLRKPVRTPQGFLRVDGYVGKAGIYEYRNDDGSIRRELRLPEEIFSAIALDGFDAAPLTIGHPSEAVTAANVRAHEVGSVHGSARQDGDHVAASIVIKDAAAIRHVESGKHQLSPGYAIDLDETPGNHPTYGRYDAIQRNIVINHLALVDQARGGSTVRLRMDSDDADNAIAQIDQPRATLESARMDPEQQIAGLKLQLDALEKTAQERKDSLSAALVERDDAKGKLRTLTDRVDSLEKDMAAGHTVLETAAIKVHSERADAAERELTDLKARRDADIRRAAEIRVKAVAVMGSTFRVDGMPDRAIQETVIKKFAPKEEVGDAVSEAYISSRFDSLVDGFVSNARSLTRAGELLGANSDQGSREVRTDSRETRARAWREQGHIGGYQVGVAGQKKDA